MYFQKNYYNINNNYNYYKKSLINIYVFIYNISYLY